MKIHRGLEELAWDTDQKRTSLVHGKNKGPSSRCETPSVLAPVSPSTNVLNTIENIGTSEEKLRNSNIALVWLKVIDGQGGGRNHVLDIIHHPGWEEKNTMLFHDCSAEVHYTLYYHIKIKIATHNAGRRICRNTLLKRSHFSNWMAFMSRDILQQQKVLSPNDISCLTNVPQRLKPMPFIQQRHKVSFIENARGSRLSTLTRLGTVSRSGGCDRECASRVVTPISLEKPWKWENVGIAYITQQNRKVFNQIGFEK